MGASEVPAPVALVATTKFRGWLARHRLRGHLRGSRAIACAAACRARASRGRRGARASFSPCSASAYPAQLTEEEPRRALMLHTLANISLLFLFFLVRPELNPAAPRRTGRNALAIIVAGISLPFAFSSSFPTAWTETGRLSLPRSQVVGARAEARPSPRVGT